MVVIAAGQVHGAHDAVSAHVDRDKRVPGLHGDEDPPRRRVVGDVARLPAHGDGAEESPGAGIEDGLASSQLV